jgi:hypothetical protein
LKKVRKMPAFKTLIDNYEAKKKNPSKLADTSSPAVLKRTDTGTPAAPPVAPRSSSGPPPIAPRRNTLTGGDDYFFAAGAGAPAKPSHGGGVDYGVVGNVVNYEAGLPGMTPKPTAGGNYVSSSDAMALAGTGGK